MLRMTQPSTVLSIFAMFLHTTFGESGCTSADGDGTLGDDEPDNFDIDCFSQLEIKDSFSSLTCNFTELPPYNTNYTLSLCTKEDNNYACSNMKKQEDAFFLQFNDILSNRDVCMYSETKRRVCRSLVVTDIVKPEVPFAINITYEREANEYLIRYCTPHSRKKYLKDKLVHQVAYRQKEGTWKTIESPYLQIKLLGRNLESEASYEVKVRSQPDGDYFKGTWSEWSTSKSFKTKREHDSMESYSTVAMIIFSILGFILSIVMIALIIIFWENRIKPAVWPNLPDHKKTLEQLCRKPKNNFDISFNPDSFGYVHIHKVDGLWAKAELENFLQPSTAPETSIQEKFRSGSDLKMIPAMADKNNLNPPMSYGGVWPAEALHRLLGTNQFAVTEGSCSSSTYEVCHSNRVPLHNDGFNLFSTPSLDPSGQTHPEPLNDDTISQMLPNSDMRSPNNEEAYVTMSNFYKIQ
ncbi:Interleukin-7 receptor subunit alpha [Corvus brachyrhynchos]|uniref:Interleukin-7 receptor subunit alpha n=1 Tax=Corvus brachyrhynchos TaxID=85066 RepID=A0A091EI26_CORBR|nr:PREDICTED: interleukin-7 receptor subunit alpha isoform X1 [Corvus brachyrhynchos]KFO56751.1 Interleukin-7 receptor subunit alpha [Corvus brachyrhynchos]